MPPRILIVDDHPVFRRAARVLLAERGFTVIAEAGCPRAALQAAAELAPDGVLMDVHLGGECGLELTRALIRGQPTLAVLLVSSEPLHRRAEDYGAQGFVLKSELAQTDLTDFWPA